MKFHVFTFVLIAVVAILGAVVALRMYAPEQTAAPAPVVETSTTTELTTQPEAPTTSSGYTLAQVATHNTRQSCWTAIAGEVYDLTAWIARHPGGANAIIGLCGTDGTATFSAQHGGQTRPEARLAEYKIGALVQ